MTTKEDVIKQLKKENPIIRSGNDDAGYTEFSPEEYAATIEMWADYELTKEAEISEAAAIKAAAQAKLAALGLTADDLKALGL